ncbi:hypothetical protein B0T26DRAFT_749510 [Lasiosphaeria miniovina]|uniref:Uncharacterized protein n=1 Tax=Lasiosphaeria miniovina TaxID=1954250 RepID=A0AA40AU36_9PEZI|nr:uncharacterized protein B0T26DRAFT_749510 [Lasiosphaeria miniovina]KAK0722050.1 hypothetical protein B0T26DRAFT_749510 [Lasiosphaeria miniovina]
MPLPLSFTTSIFGIKARNSEDGLWTVAEELRIIIPVSMVVMIATLQLTCFDFVRELFVSALDYVFTWIVVRTGFYQPWLANSHMFNTETIKAWRKEPEPVSLPVNCKAVAGALRVRHGRHGPQRSESCYARRGLPMLRAIWLKSAWRRRRAMEEQERRRREEEPTKPEV